MVTCLVRVTLPGGLSARHVADYPSPVEAALRARALFPTAHRITVEVQ